MALELLLSNNPQRYSPDYYRKSYRKFIEENCFAQLENLILTKVPPAQHITLEICSYDLVHFDSSLAHYTINHPKLLIQIFEEALYTAQLDLFAHPSFKIKYKDTGSVKHNSHIRLINLPSINDYHKSLISDIQADNIGRLIQVSGTIVKTGMVKLLEVSKQYQCKRLKCGHRFRVYADPEQDNQLPQPRRCPCPTLQQQRPNNTNNNNNTSSSSDINNTNNSSSATNNKPCPSQEFIEVADSKICVDYQEIKIQDRMENLGIGAAPRTLSIVLKADLVDRFHPGDKVCIIGFLVRQWRYLVKGDRCILGTVLYANNIQSAAIGTDQRVGLSDAQWHGQFQRYWDYWRNKKNDIFTGRDAIVKSFCPQLYGMYYVKLAVLLTLIGGSQLTTTSSSNKDKSKDINSSSDNNNENNNNNNTTSSNNSNNTNNTNNTNNNNKQKTSPTLKVRTQSHLLIVGDPGCGKSQILRFIAAVCPRTVLTTGIGTTGAGLTCSAVREGNEWTLEAGALVLANEGVCCIDEFSSIRTSDRATIHEAMEQQTISVAKAGLVNKLHTNATVIATCNPKGVYDVSLDISTNTAIATPLLSRFDLVLVLLDQARGDWDKKISTFLLTAACGKSDQEAILQLQQQRQNAANGTNGTNGNNVAEGASSNDEGDNNSIIVWDTTALREYLIYVKSAFQPIVGQKASHLMMRYFHTLRQQSSGTGTGAVTVRLLESLVRLSQAHARLCCQSEVQLQDAVVAIYCVSLSQSQSSLLEMTASALQSEFPTNSQEEYNIIERRVFSLLKCSKAAFLNNLGSKNSSGSVNTNTGTYSTSTGNNNSDYNNSNDDSNNYRNNSTMNQQYGEEENNDHSRTQRNNNNNISSSSFSSSSSLYPPSAYQPREPTITRPQLPTILPSSSILPFQDSRELATSNNNNNNGNSFTSNNYNTATALYSNSRNASASVRLSVSRDSIINNIKTNDNTSNTSNNEWGDIERSASNNLNISRKVATIYQQHQQQRPSSSGSATSSNISSSNNYANKTREYSISNSNSNNDHNNTTIIGMNNSDINININNNNNSNGLKRSVQDIYDICEDDNEIDNGDVDDSRNKYGSSSDKKRNDNMIMDDQKKTSSSQFNPQVSSQQQSQSQSQAQAQQRQSQHLNMNENNRRINNTIGSSNYNNSRNNSNIENNERRNNNNDNNYDRNTDGYNSLNRSNNVASNKNNNNINGSFQNNNNNNKPNIINPKSVNNNNNTENSQSNKPNNNNNAKGFNNNPFVTAKDQYVKEGKQFPPRPPPSSSTSSNNSNSNNNKSSSSSSSSSYIVPPELEQYDAALLEKIECDIIQNGAAVQFRDIAGLEFAKSCVNELICWPMSRPDLFQGLRSLPKGLLLFGPPGTGKTLIGKAVAHQTGATFFSISSSSLTSKWIGEGEKTVRVLFALAAYRQPSVIFIDEVDSLLCQRSSDENEASRRMKTEFLVQLDGAGTDQSARVVVIGATNRPEELDEAARRRFVKRLYIPLPDVAGRLQLFQRLLSDCSHLLTDSEIDDLVNKTEGYSGADIRNLCTEAAMCPMRELAMRCGSLQDIQAADVPSISLNHFQDALDGMTPSVSQDDLKRYIEWNTLFGTYKRMQ